MGIEEGVDDLLKESTAFPNVTCDSHRTSVMLLKPFFHGQVESLPNIQDTFNGYVANA